MAGETYEVAQENGKPVFLSEDGSATFEDGSPAIDKVIKLDHHRFVTAGPDEINTLIEAEYAVIT
jgi:hypothetical protein